MNRRKEKCMKTSLKSTGKNLHFCNNFLPVSSFFEKEDCTDDDEKGSTLRLSGASGARKQSLSREKSTKAKIQKRTFLFDIL